MKIDTLFNDAAACRELFENANDLIQSVDANGRFLYVNKKWRDVLGYTDEEALKMAFSDIIHQDHLQVCYTLFAELKKGKSLDNVRTQFVAKSGQVVDVSGSISVRMKDGKFLSTWGIFRETVSHTKIEDTMRQEQKFSQALIDSLPSIFYVFEVPSLRMVRWNRALAHIFGFSNEETAKMSPIDFIDEQDKKKAEETVRDVIARGKNIAEVYARAKDGSKIPYLFSSVYTTIAEKGYVVGVGIDITDLRKREEELAQAKAVLKVRDEQVAKEHELNRAKSEFVSLASHQLKTPLTIIKWYINMLTAGYAGGSLEKEKEYLEKIYNNTERMIELIDAFLNVSRLELGVFSIKKEPINLKDKMELILENFAPKIKEKNLELIRSYTKSNFVFASDVKMIQIIFENLISNAIKYTPSGGQIQVRMQKKGNEILVGVADTGIGIPKNQQSKIFTKFFRADNATTHKSDGTGLGLYIVKAVVEKIGGKIRFKSPACVAEATSARRRPAFVPPPHEAMDGRSKTTAGKPFTADKNGTAFYVTFYVNPIRSSRAAVLRTHDEVVSATSNGINPVTK